MSMSVIEQCRESCAVGIWKLKRSEPEMFTGDSANQRSRVDEIAKLSFEKRCNLPPGQIHGVKHFEGQKGKKSLKTLMGNEKILKRGLKTEYGK